MRVPGMLHGRVVRPPYAGVDAGDFVGTSLIAVDEASVRDIPGLVAVVSIGDFVGVVAEREENAIKAAAQLKVTWKPVPTLPDLKDIETALRANPSTPRVLIDKGDVDAAIAAADKPMQRTYVWPYQMHGSIGPSCAVAEVGDDGVRVWSGTQNPHHLRTDLALLLSMANLFYRDVKYLFDVVLTVWMFGSAVVYPVEGVGGWAGAVLRANPMTAIVEAYRSVLLYGTAPDPVTFGCVAALGLVLLPWAWLLFHRLEFRFAENI